MCNERWNRSWELDLEANRERYGKQEGDWLELDGKRGLRLKLDKKWILESALDEKWILESALDEKLDRKSALNAEQRLDWERETTFELNWEQTEVPVPNNTAASRLSAGETQNGADCTKRSSWSRKEEVSHYGRESCNALLTLFAPWCPLRASGCSTGIPCDSNSTCQSDARKAHFS